MKDVAAKDRVLRQRKPVDDHLEPARSCTEAAARCVDTGQAGLRMDVAGRQPKRTLERLVRVVKTIRGHEERPVSRERPCFLLTDSRSSLDRKLHRVESAGRPAEELTRLCDPSVRADTRSHRSKTVVHAKRFRVTPGHEERIAEAPRATVFSRSSRSAPRAERNRFTKTVLRHGELRETGRRHRIGCIGGDGPVERFLRTREPRRVCGLTCELLIPEPEERERASVVRLRCDDTFEPPHHRPAGTAAN